VPKPVITSLTPNLGPVGTNFRIFGSNFFIPSMPDQPPSVTLGSGDATVLSYNGSNIYCQVPPGASTGNVVVFAVGGSSNGVLFTVTTPAFPPNISSLSPTHGPAGTPVTISGTHFGTSQGSSTVTFNGVAATVSSWSDTSIVASVPATATTGNVVVTVGGVASNGVLFTVGTPSNGGTQQPLNLFLILGMNFLNPAIWTLDPTNSDDAGIGGFYFWKVEDVIAGRTPTISRIIVSYRNLGVATFTLTLTGTDDSGNTVLNSTPVTVGTSKASGRICSKVIGLALTGQNLQVSVSRDPGSGPLSITKLRMEGRVETTVY
jgi:hypothetical protein